MIVEWSFAMLALKRRRADNKPPCSLPRLAISPTHGNLRRYCGATSTATFNSRRHPHQPFCVLEDIAFLTAGKDISEDLGIELENVTLDMLGSAKRVHIDKDNTTIIDGAGRKKDIESRGQPTIRIAPGQASQPSPRLPRASLP